MVKVIELIAVITSIGVFIFAINVIYTTLKQRRYNKEKKLKENKRKDLELLKEKMLEEFKSDDDVHLDGSYKQVKYLRKEFMKRTKKLQNKE